MGHLYWIRWQNPEAKGSSDLIKSDLLKGNTAHRGLTHATICGRKVVPSTFDIEPEGDAFIFRYGGDNSKVNADVGIYRGDMRLVPSALATARQIEWRESGEKDFEWLDVRVEKVRSVEGDRRSRGGTYIVRASGLAFAKIADAKSRGPLRCEACGSNGHLAYAEVTDSAFEVHHKDPLHAGQRETDLDDLAVICANCHNALHAFGDEPFSIFLSRFDGDSGGSKPPTK